MSGGIDAKSRAELLRRCKELKDHNDALLEALAHKDKIMAQRDSAARSADKWRERAFLTLHKLEMEKDYSALLVNANEQFADQAVQLEGAIAVMEGELEWARADFEKSSLS